MILRPTSTWLASTWLASTILATTLPVESAVAAPRGELDVALPPGPAARAWSSTRRTAPATLDARTVALARAETWNDPAAWKAWAEDLAAEREAADVDPARRARLALAALGQGRSEAAWDHFAALSGRGEWLAAVLPAFLPGVDAGASLEALPDGTRIAPALPPLDRPSAERVLGYGRLERREMTVQGLRIGEAVVDVRVGVEYDAIQVDVSHRSGGAATLTVVLPEPLDFALKRYYVDWETHPEAEPITVSVSAETPKVEIAATCPPFDISWPMTLPAELDRRAQVHGLEVSVPAGDPLEPRVRGFAAALQRVTGRETVVRDAKEARATPALAIGFEPHPRREHKLRGLVEALEHFALRR